MPELALEAVASTNRTDYPEPGAVGEDCAFIVVGESTPMAGGYPDVGMRFTADGPYTRKDGSDLDSHRG